MVTDKRQKRRGGFRPQAPAIQTKHGARPFGVALRQERQIEQPLARIIDDPDRQCRRAAADVAHELAERTLRREMHVDADFADIGRAPGPIGGDAAHRFDTVEIREARQPVRLGAFEPGGDQAAIADHAQQRHAAWIMERAQQIVDQAGDEDGLAGAA